MTRTLVIGIGNAWRGDDGVGAAVVQVLAGTPGIQVARCGGEPAELMQCWAGFDRVILVDAVVTGGTPGAILRLTVDQPLPSIPRHSSHGLGLAEAVELARALGELPPGLVIYGIEPQSTDDGTSLSPAVADAVTTVARAICEELDICRRGAEAQREK
ncbi:hydrogenase maturation protease [Thioalkalivibrio sulfidiphilus]|uniref:hydrogenase maturation protease n=1 Tax=Thioalkalivibrio sulfidiphilus TaxID=1033854 RepID=UPI003BB05840